MTSAQQPFERRRGEVERSESMYGRVFTVVGFIELNGCGEALVDVNFPVWFIERPAIGGAGEVGEGAVLTGANYPIFSVGAVKWVTEDKPGGARYYTGAQLAVVVLGPSNQKSVIHWQAQGKALVAPLNDAGSTDDTI